jgi:hypothetical protein
MQNIDWQLIVVISALAGAGAYLVRRALSLCRSASRATPGKCGGCSNCDSVSTGTADVPGTFVSIEVLKSRDPRSQGNA